MTTMTMIDATHTISEDDIADYLLATPDFFERHAALLAQVQLVHPHNGRAISLADRQLQLQREKFEALRQQQQQLLSLGKENLRLAHKLHQWVLGLLAHASANANANADPVDSEARFLDAAEQLCQTLQSIFDVPQASVDRRHAAVQAAKQMQRPRCGLASSMASIVPDGVTLSASAAPVASMAIVPLPDVGLLVLASSDSARFTADMDTEFLTRLGELAHAALYANSL